MHVVSFLCVFQQATTTMADRVAAMVEIMVNTTIIKLETIKINIKTLDARCVGNV